MEVVMRKDLLVASALVALLAAPALAQDTPAVPAGGQQAVPAAGATSGSGFVARQEDDEMLTSSLIGTSVVSAANESMGDINDLLLASDGRLKAAVVGVGGFIGIAERDVAVPWGALAVSRNEDGDLLLRLDVTREQLEAAPEFETVADRRAAEQAARMPQTPAAPGAGGAVAPAQVQPSTQ
jgi:hypothetical protein